MLFILMNVSHFFLKFSPGGGGGSPPECIASKNVLLVTEGEVVTPQVGVYLHFRFLEAVGQKCEV
jgi:hypothetical protein